MEIMLYIILIIYYNSIFILFYFLIETNQFHYFKSLASTSIWKEGEDTGFFLPNIIFCHRDLSSVYIVVFVFCKPKSKSRFV